MPGIAEMWDSRVWDFMNSVRPRRISGTYWERLLLIALPIPLIAMVVVLLRNDWGISQFPWEIGLTLAVTTIMIWIMDCEPTRRVGPVALFDGTNLFIGTEAVLPSSIMTITPIRRYRQLYGQLFKIVYGSGGNTKTVYILSKPDVAPLGVFMSLPKTIRLLLRSHPELHNRLQPEHTT